MTSGQDAARRRDPRRSPTLVAAVAALSAVLAGCAQLQQGWRDRIRVERPGETARGTSIAEPPRSSSSDPYAARVGLDDGRDNRSWTTIRDLPPPPASAPAGSVATTSNPVLSASMSPPDPATRPIPEPASPAPASLVSSPATTTPEPPAPPIDELDAIEVAIDRGLSRLDSLRNYRVSLDRQELVRETLQEPETVTLNVRTEPFAVRLEWPDGPSKGREVLYSEAECNGLMHVKMAKTLIPIPPMQLEPTSPIALSNARHPITEAGLRHILDQTREQLIAARSGDPTIGAFSLIGPHVPEGFDVPCVEILRETPTGERWRLVVEESTSIPLLLEATDADGRLLESYRFRDLQADLAELDDPGAFDPAVRFSRSSARAD